VDLERFRGYLSVLARLGFDRKLSTKMDPSDIVQETLLEAHRSRDLFRGKTVGEQAAWLRSILSCNLANAGRDLRRAKRDLERERSIDDSSLRLEAWLRSEGSSPSGRFSREERVLLLSEAIASLPVDEQDVLLFRYCMDWTLEAIGGHLGVSRNTVARLLRRSLAALRDRLRSLDVP
jgi:RNA polymerase sigma-70 factor (ECF subfamily)